MFAPLPNGWLAAGALALLIATGGGFYVKGRSDANANCRAAALAAALATAQADLAIIQQARQREHEAAERLSAQAEADRQRVAEYERTLQGRDPCALTPADVDRLRQLGGPR